MCTCIFFLPTFTRVEARTARRTGLFCVRSVIPATTSASVSDFPEAGTTERERERETANQRAGWSARGAGDITTASARPAACHYRGNAGRARFESRKRNKKTPKDILLHTRGIKTPELVTGLRFEFN